MYKERDKLVNRKKGKKNQYARTVMAVFFILLAVVFAVLAGSKAQHSSRETNLPVGESTSVDETTETSVPTTQAPVAAQTRVDTGREPEPGEKVIYLTFDDGPTENTDNIMDALDRYGVKGTFFVVHSYDGCEKQIKEIYDRGHQVALHTYSHRYEIYRSQETYFADLKKISDLVYNATGYRCKLVRFPGGSSNTISRNYCSGIMTALTQELPKRGYAYFDWNADSFDASARVVPAEKIVNRSTSPIGQLDQVILLMHDALLKTTTVDALPKIIEAYRDAGYRFDVLSAHSFTVHHTVNN